MPQVSEQPGGITTDQMRCSVTALTAPTEEPVSLDEAKAQMVVQHNRDNTLITSEIASAREWCENETRRQFVTATKKLWMSRFPTAGDRHVCAYQGAIVLPTPALQTVSTIEYLDAGGTVQTLPTADYQFTEASTPGRILPGPGKSWPTTESQRVETVRVTFDCGYGDAAAVKPGIKHAILLLVSDIYAIREPKVTGSEGVLQSLRMFLRQFDPGWR